MKFVQYQRSRICEEGWGGGKNNETAGLARKGGGGDGESLDWGHCGVTVD